METDLFDTKTDKQKLYEWLLQKKWAKTSDVIRWGSENHSNRANRNAQQLVFDGKLFRMREDLQDFRFGKLGEDVYTIYENEKR